ncbi:MAG: hypothetical protein ACFFER_06015 [Candidatus Thorarchaeota archaeon]
MNDEDLGEIKFKGDVATGHALKIILLLLIFILPFILILLLQGIMIDLWGDPSPTSPFYLALIGALLIWFAAGYAIIIPQVGQRIDARYSTN